MKSVWAGRLAASLAVAIVFLPRVVAGQTAGPGAEQSGVVRGSITDGAGAAIPRPTLIVRPEAGGPNQLVESGFDGSFEVVLPAGRYLLTVASPGFAPGTQTFSVPSSDPIAVQLSPAQVVEHVTVVSASRQAELRESLSTRVDVVTRSRIEETAGQETVGEILRELPGVVTRRGSESANSAGEQIQGIDSRQVLVLLDGQPLVGARGIKRGGVLNLDRQSTARLERVEVVKGASSALYGSEALGGVINLITREPASPLETTVALSAGSFGAVDARVDGGFRHNATFGVFSVERHEQDGFDLTPTTLDTTGAPTRRYDAMAKLRHQFAPSLAVSGVVTGYSNKMGGRSFGELGLQEDDIRDRSVSANVALDWTPQTGTHLEARAYVSDFREAAEARLVSSAAPVDPSTLEQHYRKFDVVLSRTVGQRQYVQAGLEWARDRYQGTNRVRDEDTGHTAGTAVAWAQHRWSVTNRVTTTLGARVDRRSAFETAVSPKAAVSVRLTDGFYARASYGRGFRAPDLGQLYYRFLSPSNFYQVIGNPSLAPEYADSWQFGGEYVTSGRRARLGVNVFRNDVRDLIDSVSVGFVATPAQLAALLEREGLDPSFRPALGRAIFTYRNLADVVTRGIELDSDVALSGNVSVGGAYTFLDAEDRETGLVLTGRHRHHGNVRLTWQERDLGLRASVRGTMFSSWVAARATSGGGVQDTVAPKFALWDVFVSKTVARGLAAFLTIDNLGNSQDPNTGVALDSGDPAPIYRPEAGRTFRVGLQWSLAR